MKDKKLILKLLLKFKHQQQLRLQASSTMSFSKTHFYVAALQLETNQSESHRVNDFENSAAAASELLLEVDGHLVAVSNVRLKPVDAKHSHDKPQFDRIEPFSECHLPVLLVVKLLMVVVLVVGGGVCGGCGGCGGCVDVGGFVN